MMFWILLGLVVLVSVLVLAFNLTEKGDTAEAVVSALGTLVIGSILSFLALIVAMSVTDISDRTYAEVVGVETYELAENARVVDEKGKLSFVYLRDGVPENYSESIAGVTWEGSTGVVEIISTNYEHGTGLVPWGLGGIVKDAVIK